VSWRYIPEQSALKPQRKQRMQPLILASWRVSPQFSQKSTGVALRAAGHGDAGGVEGGVVVDGGTNGADLCTAPIMHVRAPLSHHLLRADCDRRRVSRGRRRRDRRPAHVVRLPYNPSRNTVDIRRGMIQIGDDLNGVSRKLSDFKGRYVLLDFWGPGARRAEAREMVSVIEGLIGKR